MGSKAPSSQNVFRKTAGRIVLGFVFATAPLLAQEAGKAAEKPSMMLWQIINFLILFGLLGYMAMKQGGPLLAARSKQIGEGLAAGEKAKAEAQKRAAAVEAKLANLEKEISSMRASAHDDREREAERIRRDTLAEINRIHHHAELEIESAGKMARLEVQRAAARLAIELAERRVRARMSPEIQSGLLQGFLGDLASQSLEAGSGRLD